MTWVVAPVLARRLLEPLYSRSNCLVESEHMALNPIDWGVVTVGRWNRAILTPAGIAQRIFERQEPATMEVLVPIDLLAPPQVKLDNMTVVADWNRLNVLPDQGHCSFLNLDRARQLSVAALTSLPETPLGAVGCNVIYRSDKPVEELRSALDSQADERLFDLGYGFGGRTVARVIPWNDGAINFSIEEDAEQQVYTVRFNFERKSVERNHHLDWLQVPIEQLRGQVHRILTEGLNINEEELNDI